MLVFSFINTSHEGWWLTWCCASIWMSDSHLELAIPSFWTFSLLCQPSTYHSVLGLYHFNLILLQRKTCLTFLVIAWSASVFGRETHIFVNLYIYIYGDIYCEFGELENVGSRLQMEAMIPTSTAPTPSWEDRYGSLMLIMEPQKSELRLKQLVKIYGKIDFRLSLAVIFFGECKWSHLCQNMQEHIGTWIYSIYKDENINNHRKFYEYIRNIREISVDIFFHKYRWEENHSKFIRILEKTPKNDQWYISIFDTWILRIINMNFESV